MNLNAIANRVTARVHGNETFTFYKAVGQTNERGEVKPRYEIVADAVGNIQPLDADALKHLEAADDTATTAQIFADFPMHATRRMPDPMPEDMFKRSDGTFWKITRVLEEWEADGWCNAGVTQVLEEPEIVTEGGGADGGEQPGGGG